MHTEQQLTKNDAMNHAQNQADKIARLEFELTVAPLKYFTAIQVTNKSPNFSSQDIDDYKASLKSK